VIKKLKLHLQLSHTHSVATVKLRSITSHVSDLDVYKKNTTHSVCEINFWK